MAGYIASAVLMACLGAGAYWNDHPILAAIFASVAASNFTAASLSSRMNNIDATIDKSVNRIWDEIADLKDR